MRVRHLFALIPPAIAPAIAPAGVRRAAITALLALLCAASVLAQEQGRYGHYDVYDPDLPPRAEYAARRAAVLQRLDSNAAMLVRAAEVETRSNDVRFEYRQRNSMLYLSGIPEAGSALLLVPRGISIAGQWATEVLFVAERNPTMEVWAGVRMGMDVASSVSGVAVVLPYARLGPVLDSLLPLLGTLYYDAWLHGFETEPLTGTTYVWDREMRKVLAGKGRMVQIKEVGGILNELRAIKSPVEQALIRKAVEITVQGHLETIRGARQGMHEYELEAIMEYAFRRLGSQSPGYPSIVGSGPNACILHYETNRRMTVPGDLVVMDCGAEYHGYTADITRTIPISGRFTPEQRAIYDLVLKAQQEAIAVCRPGNHFRLPHRQAVDVIGAGLVRLGILKDEQDYTTYFMHGTSHYLGLDVHDVGNTNGTLKPGMVLTVEPGIYIPAGSDCDPKWWNIGVRIEDDILVAEDGPVNLSQELPRSAEEIERLMQGE